MSKFLIERGKTVGSESAQTIYLRDICRTPLLSREEEIELAVRVKQGDVLARDRMIRANLRLVIHLARGYLGRGLSLEDLVSEANLGLMRAVEAYDGTRNVRFTTYASYWIKQSIRGALSKQHGPVRFPSHILKLANRWRTVSALLGERLGRPATVEEVARILRVSARKRALIVCSLQYEHPHAPLDTRAAATGGALGFLIDDRRIPVEEAFLRTDEFLRVAAALERVEGTEGDFLRMRFGFEPYTPLSLREIGERLDLTPKQVRRLQRRANERFLDSYHRQPEMSA